MRKIFLLFLIVLILVINVKAQKKLVFDVNVGLNNSIGKNVIKTHYLGVNTGSRIDYFSRQKYKNPVMNITGSILYPVNNNFLAGIHSGIYIMFLQQYITSVKRTSISVPLQLVGRYKILSFKQNSIGVNVTAGFNFFNIYDGIERYKSGQLFNASLFYQANKKQLLKIGIEKQIDNVSFYVYKFIQNHPDEIFKYKINRLFIALSYGIIL